MTLSRRSTIKAIGVVGTGSALTGTALAVNEHEDDERDDEQAPDDDEEVGAIRVGHFSPDAPNVDVYVDGQQILSDVGYDELSPYLEIVPGTYTVTITAAGDDEPVYERTIAVDSEFYTAAAIGELEGESGGASGDGAEEPSTAAAIQESENESDGFGNDTDADDSVFGDPFENDTETGDSDAADDETGTDADDGDDTGTFEILLLVDSQPDDIEEEGTAPLRFVHAVPDAPAVDIADGETGATIFEDVGFTEPSGYVPVEPGTRTVELFPAGESDLEGGSDDDADNDSDAENDTALGEDGVISRPDPVASVELELEADTVYTAYAIGYLEEQDEEELSVDEEEYATDEDEFGEDGDGEDEADEDRSLSVRVAVDGEVRDEDDADEEPGVEDDELEPDDRSQSGANETESTEESAAPTDEPTEPAGGSNESTDGGMNGTDGHHTDEHHADD